MDAKDHPVISVLGDQRRFVVPIYQRQYSWKAPRLGPFWDDVVAKAEQALDGKPKFSHYMGALILAPGGDGFTIGATPRVQVVDGQQRLTTFQLFLASLRDVGEKLGLTEMAPVIGNYLFMPAMHGDKGADARFRLIPTPEDRQAFHLVVEHGLQGARAKQPDWFFQNGNPRGTAPNAVGAVDFLMRRIEKYVVFGIVDYESADAETADLTLEAVLGLDTTSLDGQRARLQALLEALLNHLKLVVITLSENDDAQVIFETLNSQAEPLLAMDLVRNNIFHRASSQGEEVETLFESKWKPFDQDSGFWKADSPRAKPKRPRIDHFLSHALTAQTGMETSLRELYSEYRAFTRPKGKLRFETVEAELDALVKYAPTYRSLEAGGGDAQVAELGVKLNLWEVSTAYPLVFCIAASGAGAEEKAEFYDLIYSYLVRRALCRLTPKNLNKTFARLTSILIKEGVSIDVFRSALASQRGPTVSFPEDGELRDAIRTKPLYHLIRRKERLADLLWDLECGLRTKYSVNTARPAKMSVEHVIPQAWMEHWTLPDGRSAPADRASGADESMLAQIRSREAAIQTLGNLTLITVDGNTVASNKAFPDKKPWLKESLLAMNLAIMECPTWDEVAIAHRAEVLGDLAVVTWRGLAAP